MKPILCILIAGAAATLVQARHWQKVMAMPAVKRKRFLRPANFAISGVFIVASSILGLCFIKANETLAYPLSAAIGLMPWETIKAFTKKPPAFGPADDDKVNPATLREFITL